MLEFTYDGEGQRLTKAVNALYPTLSYNHLRSLLRNKDIMVNGRRIKEDVILSRGNIVRLYTTVYTPESYVYNVETVYEDNNLFVFNKPKGLETEGEISALAYAKRMAAESVAVHRLDVNTDGLLIIAKNEHAATLLKSAIKKREIQKFYLAAVYGTLKESDLIIGFLSKDAEKNRVRVTDKPEKGSVKIMTEYRTVFSCRDYSVLEINLLTGRTHQIRAQMAFLGHQVLGDGKYGKEEINSRFSYKKQALTAYKLVFDTEGELAYLNGKRLEIDCELKNFC